jgi:hypothetical protein
MGRIPWLFILVVAVWGGVLAGGAFALNATAAQPAPALVVTPPTDTDVAPGQSIEFALEVRGRPGPHRFALTWLDTGALIGEATTEGVATFSFQVPLIATPGQALRFLAQAEGPSAGSADAPADQFTTEPFRESAEIELRVRAVVGGSPPPSPSETPRPTPDTSPSPSPSLAAAVEEWEGSFRFQIDAFDGDTGVVSFGSVVTGEFTFRVDRSLDPTGAFGLVQGNGRATRMSYGGRSGDCAVQYSYPPESLPFSLGGALLSGRFSLVLSDPNPTMATITVTCPGSGSMSSTIPVPADVGLHTFGIELAAEDGARFTIDQRSGGLHERGELTVRRVRTASAP